MVNTPFNIQTEVLGTEFNMEAYRTDSVVRTTLVSVSYTHLTTRPETIMGDTAMCINPNDPKNQHLKGKKVIVPDVYKRQLMVYSSTWVA